jgi:hypothetical protein
MVIVPEYEATDGNVTVPTAPAAIGTGDALFCGGVKRLE